MKGIILGITTLFTCITHAQVKYEKGYIINKDDDKRKEVLIKNLDWVNNPDEFTYKIGDKTAELKGSPSTIKEFSVYGFSKYKSYNGSIDTSSSDLSNLSNQSNPENQQVNIFLKELISGDKNLYSYQGSKSSIRFFYSNSDASEIKSLIYKKYHPDGNQSLVATNEGYLEQLKTLFANDAKATALISQTKYNSNNLSKIFKIHNEKISGNFSDETKDKVNKSAKFNLYIRPGVNFYSPLKTNELIGNSEFPSKMSLRIGIEAEVILPFNKNKWAILLEPTYSFYTNKKITAFTGNNLYKMSLDSYSFINIPLGIRHYLYLNDDSKFFINGQVNVLTLKSGKAHTIDLDYDGYVFDSTNLSKNKAFKSFSFGAGYNYKNKYSFEVRYNTANNIIEDQESQTAKMSYASVIIGYNLF